MAFAAVALLAPVAVAQMRGAQPSAPMSPQPGTQGTPGINTPGQPNTPSETMPAQRFDDRRFVKDASLSAMTEIELGKLAAEKGSTDAVKQFGQKLADDNTKTNDELKQIAGKEGMTVPDSLDSKHQSQVDKLAKLSGPEFDRAFLKDEMKDQHRDVSEFESEARDGSDANVKGFASRTLPTVQAELSTVKELNESTSTTSQK